MNAGAAHISTAETSESWMSDDQISDMAAGVNGPITRSEASISIRLVSLFYTFEFATKAFEFATNGSSHYRVAS